MSLVTNKKAGYNYTILRKIEVGIVLVGSEVKSISRGDASLAESFARIVGGEVFLYGMHVNPYKYDGYAPATAIPTRVRKLLLNASEIRKLDQDLQTKPHTTLVPISLYKNAKGKIKLELALAEGKREFDKRETLKKKDAKREMREFKR